MKSFKVIASLIAMVAFILAIMLVLKSNNSLVIHPKGIMAKSELELIVHNIGLMLVIIIPTTVLFLFVAWKYRDTNSKAKYNPDQKKSRLLEIMLWVIPAIIVAFMSVITWRATHKLDPYRPLDSEVKPLTIQVIAFDWKWLFIYPEQEIATLNFVQFPEKTPIRFELAADNSPMNSFWIPELSGQIYAMTGMITPLHVMADGLGTYLGRAAEINGKGYAGMTFTVKSTSEYDFEKWVEYVKHSPLKLDSIKYHEFAQRIEDTKVAFYSSIDTGLFDRIVMQYMHGH